MLIGITSSGKPLRGFTPKELLPAECLSSLVGMLSESNVKPSLHNKAMVLLFNLGESLFIIILLFCIFHPFFGDLQRLSRKRLLLLGWHVVTDCQCSSKLSSVQAVEMLETDDRLFQDYFSQGC